MKRRHTLIGLAILGLAMTTSIGPRTTRADDSMPTMQQPTALRHFNAHHTDSFHYDNGILTFTTGDIDGDHDIDIVGGDFYSADFNHSLVWLNNGTGIFSETLPLSNTVNNATDVELSDLDGDQDLDLIVARTEENPELILMNDGHGTFTQASELGTGFTFQIVVADFDGDHDLDLLARNEQDPDPFDSHPTDAREIVWLNDGHGNFSEHTRFEGGDLANLYPADMDNDGDIDMLASDDTSSFLLQNDGHANFSEKAQSRVSEGGIAAIGDLDGDGDMDGIGAAWGRSEYIVWRNNGTGIFAMEITPVSEMDGWGFVLGDLDHDGDLDAVWKGNEQQEHVVLNNDGSGHFNITQSFGGYTVAQMLLADVNNDTWLDFVKGINPHISSNPLEPSIWLNEPLTVVGTLYMPMLRK